MKIIVDAFGGDNAPFEVLKGVRAAIDEHNSEVVVVGDEDVLATAAASINISLEGIEIVSAPDTISMEDDPREILKAKAKSSMAVGLKLLAEGYGSAFLSAGNTGALVFGATYTVGRIEGVKRPAIAVAIPNGKGCYLLLDAGANLECRPEHLVQFGVMGSVYYSNVFGKESPQVGLINVGKEPTKGTAVAKEAYQHLTMQKVINFTGNVETRELPKGGCDVAVTDGFTGNMILKLSEGLASMLFSQVKSVFTASKTTKLAAAMVMNQFRAMAGRFDYSEYGGTPLLGICKPVIKAHGSSKADAFKNAILKAEIYANTGVVNEIKDKIALL